MDITGKTKNTKKGVMTANYHQQRLEKLAPRYRLKRRGDEIIRTIKKYKTCYAPKILDIGAADGLMLSRIKKEFPQTECAGLEYSDELIATCSDKNIKIIQGDAQNLPFADNYFDIILATAIIEHLDRPTKMLDESYRVLKKEGLIILTTPNPFFEKIADWLNHFEKNIHQETFTIYKLKKYLAKSNFKILATERFMISPIGLPGELKFEKIIKFLKLDFILLNQLAVGKK
jgi:ubiquinone/menaquinone biosynthesis C-methylase UbiE